QGALALGLAWAVCRLAPRLPGSVRCWVWRLAYAKLLLALFWGAPVELRVLPPRPSEPPVLSIGGSVTAPGLERTHRRVVALERPVVASPAPPVAPQRQPASWPQPAAWLLLAWLAGAGWYLLRVGLQGRRTAALRRRCETLRDADAARIHERLCARLRLRKTPELLVAEVSGPLVMGVIRPAVVLPQSLQATEAEQEWILAHELAHVKRRDLLWAHLPVLTRVLFFFHPLVWVAHREWRLAQEMACDALTVEITAAPLSGYGELLVRLAAGQKATPSVELSAAGILETGNGLERRLGMLAIGRLVGRRRSWIVGIALWIGLLGLVPWRLAASASAASERAVTAAQVRAAETEAARLRARTTALERELSLLRQEAKRHQDALKQWDTAQRRKLGATRPTPPPPPRAPVPAKPAIPARPATPAPIPASPIAPPRPVLGAVLTDRELLELAGAPSGSYSALIGTLSPTELLQYLRVELQSTMEELSVASARFQAGVSSSREAQPLTAKVRKLEVLLSAAERRVKLGGAPLSLAASLEPREMVQFLRADLQAAMTELRQERARVEHGESPSSVLFPLQTRVQQLELLIGAAERRAKGG
ncbi:MAG: antirepressor regulating drug resistance protein, partial [Armatimonadetes bacterium]|nr:antirepressor regulating drug resistance protein [Armatimonadota bacterium]